MSETKRRETTLGSKVKCKISWQVCQLPCRWRTVSRCSIWKNMYKRRNIFLFFNMVIISFILSFQFNVCPYYLLCFALINNMSTSQDTKLSKIFPSAGYIPLTMCHLLTFFQIYHEAWKLLVLLTNATRLKLKMWWNIISALKVYIFSNIPKSAF